MVLAQAEGGSRRHIGIGHFGRGVANGGMVVHDFPFHFAGPARRGRERQIFRVGRLMQLHGIDIGEGVEEMDGVDGVIVESALKSPQACVALGVLIDGIVVDGGTRARCVDIAVDAVNEYGGLEREAMVGVVESEVGLQTMFGAECALALLVANRAFVHAVSTQFRHVRRAETASQVQSEVQVVLCVEYCAEAAGQSVEVAAEVVESRGSLIVHRFAVQVSAVEAYAAAQCKLAQCAAYRGIGADVVETVGGD